MTIMSASSPPGAPVALSAVTRRYPTATRALTAAHTAVVRRTHGLVAARWFGMSVLLLETVGRRSGRPRSAALVYLPDGADLVVVAANAGAERPPGWWLNLQAAGEGVAITGGDRRPVTASMVAGARRDRLWRRFAAVSPVDHYQRQTARRLSVVALTPLSVQAGRRVGDRGCINCSRRSAMAVA